MGGKWTLTEFDTLPQYSYYDVRCTTANSQGPLCFAEKKKKKTTGNSTSTQKELHCRERNERPRQQASFDTDKCANVTAPDGTNECITASQPNFTSTVRCSRNEHNASIDLNDDGGKGREEREG